MALDAVLFNTLAALFLLAIALIGEGWCSHTIYCCMKSYLCLCNCHSS